jgi:hypothetical protein
MIEILILTATYYAAEAMTVAPVRFFVKNKPIRKRLQQLAARKPARRFIRRVANRVHERPRLRAVRGFVTGTRQPR